VRLVTFNVLHGRSPDDGRVDLDRYAEAVRSLDADVLALQEVDRDQPRSGGADLTAVAARALAAEGHVFAPALAGLPGEWRQAAGQEPAGTPLYGVGLVTRCPVLSSRVVRLPALPGVVPVLFPGRRAPVLVRDEPRVAAVARLDVPGGPLTVVCTHLSFVPGWNQIQLRRLVRQFRDVRPLALLGDLNVGPERLARVSGLRPLAAGLTFPAHAPTQQLDHVLARGLAPAAPGHVLPLPMSDHRALLAVARLRGGR
jgi:endonuclease/exonuclease/phosphatase family metal-dependent hydrolase